MKPQWITDWSTALRECETPIDNPVKMWDDIDGVMHYNPLGVLCELHDYKRVVKKENREIMSHVIRFMEITQFVERYSKTNKIYNPVEDYMINHKDDLVYHCYDKEPHTSGYSIPISLTGKLNCNAPLMFLGSNKPSIKFDDGSIKESSIQSIIGLGLDFDTIADVIDDWWPLLTFKDNGGRKELSSKTYGKLRIELE